MVRILNKILALFGVSYATTKSTGTPVLSQVVETVEPSIVQISTAAVSGSGFFFDNRWVATNAHVVDGVDTAAVILNNGSRLQGEVIGRNEFVDLAVISVGARKSSRALTLADSDRVKIGEDVLALGFPGKGIPGTVNVTRGIVSAVGVFHNGCKCIQTDAATNPGNSGGPLR